MSALKKTILSRSIEDDQRAVALQWTNTFKHNPSDDVATNIAKFLFSCVLKGDFKTRTYLEKELSAPCDKLTAIDYLSHASRIIIDYQELSEEHQARVVDYFPVPSNESARSATHAVTRGDDGQAIELKGFWIGITGQAPLFLKDAKDFGINIAMGGQGQKNAAGKTIEANGYSGHMYFHHDQKKKLLMAGLEQSAPPSLLSLLLHLPLSLLLRSEFLKEEQSGTDHFGQSHSIVGSSDTYTAANSLYFSDPIYQAKFLVETGRLPPDKYGAMQVKLTEENWPNIESCLQELNAAIRSKSDNELQNYLMQKPGTASLKEQPISSYVALDFTAYLQRIYEVFISEIHDLDTAKRLKTIQNELLEAIKALQTGNVDNWEKFISLVQEIKNYENAASNQNNQDLQCYVAAIKRIEVLFKLQLKIDPELCRTQQDLLLQNQYDELQRHSNDLMQKIVLTQQYFSSPNIVADSLVESYQLKLKEQLEKLKSKVLAYKEQEGEEHMSESWIFISEESKITLEMVEDLQKANEEAEELLAGSPKLYDEEAVRSLKQELVEVEVFGRELELKLMETKAKLADKKASIRDLAAKNEQLDHSLQEVIMENNWKERLLQAEREENNLRESLLRVQTQRVEAEKQILTRKAAIIPIHNDLITLNAKVRDLEKRNCPKEAKLVRGLVATINAQITNYLYSESTDDDILLQNFKMKCINHVEETQRQLKNKKGLEFILCNTLIALLTCGVGFLIHKAATGRYCFFEESKSSKKVESLRKTFDTISPLF